MGRRACLALVVAAAACQDNVSTPFPPGLEPFPDDGEPGKLEADRAERLVTRSRTDDRIRVYGRGFVFAPPAVVWAAAHDPAVMIARCATSSQTVTPDNELEYELSFLVHYFVDEIVNVEWDDQWRGGVIVGDPAAPLHVMIEHQKVQGSDFISISEGTVQLRAVDGDDITELQFVEHLDAVGGSAGDVTDGMQDNYARLVAAASGRALPSCTR